MIRLEKYTGVKTYMFPTSEIATPEVVKRQFPAVDHFIHVVETDENGEVMFALSNLSALRSSHGIDPALGVEEAIAAIQVLLNTPPEPVVSTDARIAEALETLASDSQIDKVFNTLEGRAV